MSVSHDDPHGGKHSPPSPRRRPRRKAATLAPVLTLPTPHTLASVAEKELLALLSAQWSGEQVAEYEARFGAVTRTLQAVWDDPERVYLESDGSRRGETLFRRAEAKLFALCYRAPPDLRKVVDLAAYRARRAELAANDAGPGTTPETKHRG